MVSIFLFFITRYVRCIILKKQTQVLEHKKNAGDKDNERLKWSSNENDCFDRFEFNIDYSLTICHTV